MIVKDPGHEYELIHIDGNGKTDIVFVKREGERYPGNVGAHEGVQVQEVVRALIDRVAFVDAQIPCVENKVVVSNLRRVIWLLESRARQRRGSTLPTGIVDRIEQYPACILCGHILCEKHRIQMCSSTNNDSGNQCGHTHRCVLHDSHNDVITAEGHPVYHKCGCGVEWV